MFLDLFISDGNDLGWALVLPFAVGLFVLPVLLLVWFVKVVLGKSNDWVWVLLSVLGFLAVCGVLSRY